MLDKEFLEKQKGKLLEKRKMLEERLSVIGEKENGDFRAKFPEYGSDEEMSALEYEDYDKNLNLEKNLERDLKATNKALERIEEGAYGTCDNCGGQEISKERLEAYPAADTCIKCRGK